MQLTLFVPGLTWLKQDNLNPIFQRTALPGLDHINQYAQVSHTPNKQLNDLYPYFSPVCDPNLKTKPQESFAGSVNTKPHSLLASPIQLTIHSDTLSLQPPELLAITLNEAKELCDSINHLVTEDGWQISPVTPTLWQITTPNLLSVSLTPLWDAVGFLNTEQMAQGKDKDILEKISTEIQMLLSAHIINQKRMEQHQPLINGIWFWTYPQHSNSEKINSIHNNGLTDRYSILATISPPADYSTWQAEFDQQITHNSPRQHEFVINELLYASKIQDIESYLDILTDLDRRYFLPAWQAVKSGKLKKLTIISHGCNGGQMTLKPVHAWFFWRKVKKFNGSLIT